MSLRTSEHAELPNTAQEIFKFTTPARVLEKWQKRWVCTTFCNVQNSLRLPRKTQLRRQKIVRTPQFLHFWLRKCIRATVPCYSWSSQFQKVARTPQFFTLLTCKSAPRHNGVQFLILSLSKSCSAMRVFDTFDFQIGSAPQQRAPFALAFAASPSAPAALAS